MESNTTSNRDLDGTMVNSARSRELSQKHKEYSEIRKTQEFQNLKRHVLESCIYGKTIFLRNLRLSTLMLGALFSDQDLREAFTEAETLFLDGNLLNELPENIGVLHNLMGLSINNNHLLSNVEAITKLRKLEELDISGNPLLADLPDMRCLTKLKGLSIRDNQNLTALPSYLPANLVFANFSKNPCVTQLPKNTHTCDYLESLVFDGTSISHVENLHMLRQLQEISFSDTPVESLNFLGSIMHFLSYVNFDNTPLDPQDFIHDSINRGLEIEFGPLTMAAAIEAGILQNPTDSALNVTMPKWKKVLNSTKYKDDPGLMYIIKLNALQRFFMQIDVVTAETKEALEYLCRQLKDSATRDNTVAAMKTCMGSFGTPVKPFLLDIWIKMRNESGQGVPEDYFYVLATQQYLIDKLWPSLKDYPQAIEVINTILNSVLTPHELRNNHDLLNIKGIDSSFNFNTRYSVLPREIITNAVLTRVLSGLCKTDGQNNLLKVDGYFAVVDREKIERITNAYKIDMNIFSPAEKLARKLVKEVEDKIRKLLENYQLVYEAIKGIAYGQQLSEILTAHSDHEQYKRISDNYYIGVKEWIESLDVELKKSENDDKKSKRESEICEHYSECYREAVLRGSLIKYGRIPIERIVKSKDHHYEEHKGDSDNEIPEKKVPGTRAFGEDRENLTAHDIKVRSMIDDRRYGIKLKDGQSQKKVFFSRILPTTSRGTKKDSQKPQNSNITASTTRKPKEGGFLSRRLPGKKDSGESKSPERRNL